jgi:hypothetical protein
VVIDGAVAPLDGEERVAPFRGQVGLIGEDRAAGRAATIIVEAIDELAGEVDEPAGVAVVAGGDDVGQSVVPGVAVVGVVAGEDAPERIDGDVIDVAVAPGVDFQARAVGSDAEDTAAVEGQLGAVLGDGVFAAEVAGGDVDPAVDAEADAVGGVVGASVLMPVTRSSLLVATPAPVSSV